MDPLSLTCFQAPALISSSRLPCYSVCSSIPPNTLSSCPSQTVNQLEQGYDSADLAYQLFFACAGINILSTPLEATIFLRPLMHALQYLSAARAPPGSQSSLFGMISIPTTYLPYTMLGIELLMGGPAAVARAAVGTIVGHLWWWRVWNVGGPTGASWAKAPVWVRRYISAPTAPPAPPSAGFHVRPPRNAQQPAASTSGHSWGHGQRLGSG